MKAIYYLMYICNSNFINVHQKHQPYFLVKTIAKGCSKISLSEKLVSYNVIYRINILKYELAQKFFPSILQEFSEGLVFIKFTYGCFHKNAVSHIVFTAGYLYLEDTFNISVLLEMNKSNVICCSFFKEIKKHNFKHNHRNLSRKKCKMKLTVPVF